MARRPDESRNIISSACKERIKELIAESDYTKIEFAQAVHVNKDVISKASVYGIIPSVRSLIRIADALNTSVYFVLGETDDRAFDKAENPKTFYERVEELANEKKESYTKIANKLPFAANSIHEWIRTQSLPSLDYLKDLANYFEVSVDYLLGRTDYRD